jgi:dephospho-CoA kinase
VTETASTARRSRSSFSTATTSGCGSRACSGPSPRSTQRHSGARSLSAGVVETPLLFEARSEGRFDATIAIVATDEIRAQRLAIRDQTELAARDRAQLSQDEKAGRATFKIVNDGTVEELEHKLAEILDSLAG